jgi:RNA recognition motif-containing protein
MFTSLELDLQDDTLKEAFSKYGRVIDCRIARQPGGVSKGYGFITYDDPRDAEDAKERYFAQGRCFAVPLVDFSFEICTFDHSAT